MMIKMIQNLENKIELQIHRLETRTEKMQMFNKDLEKVENKKKSQSRINNVITDQKHSGGNQQQNNGDRR